MIKQAKTATMDDQGAESIIQSITEYYTVNYINPLVNGLSHPYRMGELTFIFRGIRSDFSYILYHFSMKIKKASRIASDGTPRFVASRLGLSSSVCLCPIKRTPGLYG